MAPEAFSLSERWAEGSVRGNSDVAAKKTKRDDVAEPLLAMDRKVRDAMLPYRETPVVEAIGTASAIGDQTQLRLDRGGHGAARPAQRRDSRMAAAGVRMALAHELATFAKGVIKENVVRGRPRSHRKSAAKAKAGRDLRPEKSSFPSGHSAGAFAVASAVGGAYPAHAGKAQAGAAAVALGRIPGCAHYPTDVAAGAAIGLASGGIVNALWRLAASALRRRRGESPGQ